MRITLIGSTRFMHDFIEWNEKLTRFGHTVYSLGFGRQIADTESITKKILDAVHLSKIQNSDTVVLINGPQDYIGDSTLGELLFALVTNKQVYATHPIKIVRDWGIGSHYVSGADNLLDRPAWVELITGPAQHMDQVHQGRFSDPRESDPDSELQPSVDPLPLSHKY